jgi:cytoskeleton protein RodZ
MTPDPPDRGPQIGSVLKETRKRLGMDIRTAETRTKIRTKYLRALENEEWDVLPGPAYARAFLRTYAELLGLDGEALVDEYRARVEEPDGRAPPPLEPLLRERRPLDDRPARFDRRILVGILVVGLAGLLVVLGITAGSDDDGGDARGRGKAERKKDGKRDSREKEAEEQAPVPETTTVRLVARSPTEVCLVSQGGDVLLDNQLMATGDEEGDFEADAFELSIGPGVMELTLNGESERLESDVPVAYRLKPRGASPAGEDPNPDCP